MKGILSSAIVMLMLALSVPAQSAPNAAELTKLLKEFLDGASRNDAAMHDRFWAEDLIYTGSAGRRIGKADIMRDARSAPTPKPAEPATNYVAEDIHIQQYGDTAIVAFRMIGTTVRDNKTMVAKYLNSGTFLKRNGRWQVVNWQATRMPRSEEDSRKEAAETEASFHQALLAADVKKLSSLMDDTFIWIHSAGESMTRQQLLDQLGSGQLKYSKLETNNVTVAVYADAAVVRGVSPRQRSSIAATGGSSSDISPFTALYTLTLVNRGGAWKAVAMHTSRP
jgi:hypothetical protein